MALLYTCKEVRFVINLDVNYVLTYLLNKIITRMWQYRYSALRIGKPPYKQKFKKMHMPLSPMAAWADQITMNTCISIIPNNMTLCINAVNVF